MVSARHINKRSQSGLSILELLVSVAVMSVAIAGLTELAWLNTSWSTRLFNHVDSHYAARLFLDRIGADIRSAHSIDSTSDESHLILNLPTFDAAGFINGTTQKTYTVDPDTSFDATSQTKATGAPMYEIQQGNVEVLHGLVGPVDTSNKVAIFQYTAPYDNTKPLNSFTATALSQKNVTGVVINLELQRLDYGGDRGYGMNAPSVFGVRNEYVLRNNTNKNP